MVTTILAVVALAGTNAPTAKPAPAWQTDYTRALASASAERKPMAVFLGQDSERLGRMLEDGTIPTEAAKLLRESYVVVHLDATTEAGKDLAARYSMSEGLVINNSTGGVQALRHAGAVAGSGLTSDLARYAATTTVTSPVIQTGGITSGVPAIVSGNCPNGRCPNVVQTGYTLPAQSYPLGQPVVGQPVSTPGAYTLPTQSFPFGATSSCPNGRCPNVR